MKKILAVMILLGLLLGACLPAALKPKATPSPTMVPFSMEELQATETFIAQMTLQIQPSSTSAPTNTPQVAGTDTPDPFFLTLGAAGAVDATNTSDPFLLTLGAASAVPVIPTTTTDPFILTLGAASPIPPDNGVTATPTNGPMHYGTMPPNLPSGRITLINRSKVEVYISLHCTTHDGYTTYIEYPVSSLVKAKIPAGKYTYVLWVGGRQILGNFKLDQGQDISIKIYKDRAEIN